MHKFIIIVLLAAASHLQAQWEQIGWRGGGVQIQAQNGNMLFGKAGTGFYRSTDWGKTWILEREGLPNHKEFCGSDIFELDGKLFIGKPTNNRILSPFLNDFFLFDSSLKTWERWMCTPIDRWFASFDLASLFFYSKDSVAMLHNAGEYSNVDPDISKNGIHFSTDRGLTWQFRMNDVPTPKGVPITRRKLVRQGRRLLLNTLDSDTLPPYNLIAVIYKTDNFGESWEKITKPISDTDYADLDGISDSLLVLHDDEKYFFSNDKGDSWFAAPSPLPQIKDGYQLVLLKQRNANLYLSFRRTKYIGLNLLYRSSDNGNSWQRIYAYDSNLYVKDVFGNDSVHIINTNREAVRTDENIQIKNILPTRVGARYGDAFLVHADKNRLLSISFPEDSITVWSHDGDTLERIPLGTPGILQYRKWVQNNGTYLAPGIDKNSSQSTLYTSSDGGYTWDGKPMPTYRLIDTLIFDSGVLYVSTGYPDSVFYSTNEGASWAKLSQPPLQGPISIAVNGELIIFSNTSSGPKKSYYTTDRGQNWNQIHTSEYDISGIFMAEKRLFFSAARQVTGGYDNTTFFSDNCGQTWAPVTIKKDRNQTLRPCLYKDGILFGITSTYWYTNSYRLYMSPDTGINWYYVGDSVIDANRLFTGGDYYFLAGEHELWRIPKLKLSVENGNSDFRSLMVSPNPFTSYTIISYTLPKQRTIDLSIYDLLGRKHTTLSVGIQEAGSHTAEWNAENTPPGVYVLRLVTSEGSATRMLQVIR